MMAAAVVFTACSDDSEAYDADTAVSNYVPLQSGRKVASLYTTNVIDGREYSFRHNFTYDKQGRIKEVNSEIKHHRMSTSPSGSVSFKLCNITSNAKYYYKGEYLEIAYNIVGRYPDYHNWDYAISYADAALLNDDGYILNFNQPPYQGFTCSYNLASLKEVEFEGGNKFYVLRDNKGNVNGHMFEGYDKAGNDSVSRMSERYTYTSIENKTNFDFAAYFGYWEHERYINALATWPYASYQLAGFGFFGSYGGYLPLCESSVSGGVSAFSLWKFDADGYPVKYTAPDGRVTTITYVK